MSGITTNKCSSQWISILLNPWLHCLPIHVVRGNEIWASAHWLILQVSFTIRLSDCQWFKIPPSYEVYTEKKTLVIYLFFIRYLKNNLGLSKLQLKKPRNHFYSPNQYSTHLMSNLSHLSYPKPNYISKIRDIECETFTIHSFTHYSHTHTQ